MPTRGGDRSPEGLSHAAAGSTDLITPILRLLGCQGRFHLYEHAVLRLQCINFGCIMRPNRSSQRRNLMRLIRFFMIGYRHLAVMVGLAAMLGLLATAFPQGQANNPQPLAPGIIRIQVRLVPVDVIVTDARGKPVTDLKVDDFRIYENGQLQEIRHFALQIRSDSTAESNAQPSNDPLEFRSQPGRIFLILMGRGRIQLPFGSVDDMIRFVRDGLHPQDRVAVFAFNRATDFTADHAQIFPRLGTIYWPRKN